MYAGPWNLECLLFRERLKFITYGWYMIYPGPLILFPFGKTRGSSCLELEVIGGKTSVAQKVHDPKDLAYRL
jgi:hypothetical protein